MSAVEGMPYFGFFSSLNIVGGILKRSTRSDCKSDGLAFEGSNPSPPTNDFGKSF